MSTGMEMMLARMLGMKPEEMRDKANMVTGAITEAAELMNELKVRMLDIQSRLERIENAITQDANVNGSIAPLQHRSRRRGNSDKLDAPD